MRVITFIVYIGFLLLGIKDYAVMSKVENQNSIKFSSENRYVKYINNYDVLTIIEDIDIDIEEEYSSDNHDNDFKFVFLKATSAIAKYSCDSLKFVYKKNFNNFNYFPSSFGSSTSIYLLNRVLRI